MESGDKLTVVLLLALVAFAVVIVDERWLRAAVAVVPALLLAQRAVRAPGTPQSEAPTVGAANRRADSEVRGHVDELLKHFREFYTTCHLMAVGSIEPDEAKSQAAGIERSLNKLLAQVTDAGRDSTN